jgi:hypothetical protein
MDTHTKQAMTASRRGMTDTGVVSETVETIPAGADTPVEMEGDTPIEVFLDDGSPVIETLRKFEEKVTDVVAAFDEINRRRPVSR